MNKTKGFIIGATLLALVLIFGSVGLACGARPAEAPLSPPPVTEPPSDSAVGLSTEPEIPANYTTYTDESGLFSISYPSDWEITPPQMIRLVPNVKDSINRLQSGLPIEKFGIVFAAGRQSAGGFEPSVNIALEPVPAGISPLDQIVESYTQLRIETYPDYRELSRIKKTVDGREATILEGEGTIPEEQYSMYIFQLLILTDKAIWVVTCGSVPEDSMKWQDDFNTIVSSLRMSN
jgi:hypothetical protein